MTRQWLALSKLMCLNHRLGEHAETHMFLRKMERGYSLKGFQEGSMFFGASYLIVRHELLALGFHEHKTPLVISDDLKEKYPLVIPTERDYEKSITDLITRCKECRYLHYDYLDGRISV